MLLNLTETSLGDAVAELTNTFLTEAGGLDFTWELPQDNSVQLLDLKPSFTRAHQCWMYNPRTKSLLPFESAHSKLIKRGIANTCLNSALMKSCEHSILTGFNIQTSRLEDIQFPPSVIMSVCKSLLQKVKQGTKVQRPKENMRTHVIPCINELPHNLKKVAARYNVRIVFSALCKLAKICLLTANRLPAPNLLQEARHTLH